MRAGHHSWRMFIQRGPIQALQKAIHLITGNTDDSPAIKMIEERVRQDHVYHFITPSF